MLSRSTVSGIARGAVIAAGISLGSFLWWRSRLLSLRRVAANYPLSNILSSSKHGAYLAMKGQTVHVVQSAVECDRLLQQVLSTEQLRPRVVGFDTEWATPAGGSQKRPVAVVQIATETAILVIQVHLMPTFPATLKALLEDRRVYKVGVDCLADGRRLQRDYGVNAAGCVDLRMLVQRSHVSPSQLGLAGLTEHLFALQLPKHFHVRCGNWEEPKLSEDQILYAAADAFFSRQIFLALFNTRAHPDHSVPTAIQSTAQAQPGASGLRWEDIGSWCQGLVDVGPKGSESHSTKTSVKQKQPPRKEKRTAAEAMSARATPLYDNCVMLSPEGNFLCTCYHKKIKWYLDHGLGTLVKESDPVTLQLNFTPGGVGNAGSKFYEEKKENICVVCGTPEKLLRHMVIPHHYRRWFPPRVKDHSSHDVVLLCATCHGRADMHQNQLRQQFAKEMGIPVDKSSELDEEAKRIRAVVQAANALLHAKQLPDERRQELLKRVQYHLGREEVTPQDLKEAKQLTYRKPPPEDRDSHGALIVSKLGGSYGTIHEFTRRWRQHFLDTLQPKFLSPYWEVDHRKPNDDMWNEPLDQSKASLQDLKRDDWKPQKADTTINGVNSRLFEGSHGGRGAQSHGTASTANDAEAQDAVKSKDLVSRLGRGRFQTKVEAESSQSRYRFDADPES